ncbi:mitochondrial import inner membrane translocase subunit PAM16 like 2-like isoform X2 [Gastrolobium bilobum]|uniref:mitochondrial import inner membrane translocase subunit PAM16 like 2-like isoform X2 n=1 Tax=Gastrolobium bilobum TaxID=150636 RepID=UPI002AB1C4FC|nr:mitochondrial import inner membrane translocase subunit PAM16 like 2-like isoform X2 [Gastrolobium bilobum]
MRRKKFHGGGEGRTRYTKALIPYASKNGVAQETIQNTIRRAGKVMTEQEARQVLGVTEETPWKEIARKYDTLFEKNAKNGSFYLQSKVHRAKQCLESIH